jgi:signal peptidase I
MENEADVQSEVPRTKKRKWWLAGLLSMIQPGLGQIYNGQIRRGVILFFMQLIVLVILLLVPMKYPSALALGAFFVVLLFVYISIILDAVFYARKLGDRYQLKSYNRIFAYIGIYVVAFLISNTCSYTIRTYLVQAFKIPAGSMEPTLLIGDHMLVDKSGSAVKNPHRGDLIVFEYPLDSKIDFIKRVIAVGGDAVEIKDKVIYINGAEASDLWGRYQRTPPIPRESSPKDNFGPVTVPPDSYFVLGDNRDNSADSRFWGFVGKDKVKGVARIIYFSWDRENSSVRWQRIGQRID